MSYRISQLSPQTSTHGMNMRIAVRGPWSDPPEGLRNMQFWRSWLELDSEEDEKTGQGRVRWNAILGLALMVGISAGFWAGVGFLVAHLGK